MHKMQHNMCNWKDKFQEVLSDLFSHSRRNLCGIYSRICKRKKYFWSCNPPNVFSPSVYNSAETFPCKYKPSHGYYLLKEYVMTSFLHWITPLKEIGSIFMQSICIQEAFVNIWWLALAPVRGSATQDMLLQLWTSTAPQYDQICCVSSVGAPCLFKQIMKWFIKIKKNHKSVLQLFILC